MARGPAPKSPAEKIARGNPGKRRVPKDVAPVVQPSGDAQPDGKLRPLALHVWNRLAPELHRLNVLRTSDSTALSRYCEYVAKFWDVTQKLRAQGDTYQVTSNHGTYQRLNPLFTIQERLEARMISLEDRFGLSPQARQALMIRAAQIATQGQLPFGSAAPDPSTPSPPVPDSAPIGFLGTIETRH